MIRLWKIAGLALLAIFAFTATNAAEPVHIKEFTGQIYAIYSENGDFIEEKPRDPGLVGLEILQENDLGLLKIRTAEGVIWIDSQDVLLDREPKLVDCEKVKTAAKQDQQTLGGMGIGKSCK